VPIGGHNLLEPASLGVPVVVGPHNFNAPDVTELFLQAGAMRIVEGPAALAAEVQALFEDPAACAQAAAAGFKVLAENRGTLPRLLGLLQPLLADLFPDAS
jgi:3-deoxy-D-manno-octulosonic-acid transferase